MTDRYSILPLLVSFVNNVTHASVTVLASATATTVASIIAAIGAVIAASIVAWAGLKAQSYKQLLKDIHEIVQTELDPDRRGPIIKLWVSQAIRELLDEHDSPKRRRYDRW